MPPGRFPPGLKKGDLIRIISPAGPADSAAVKRGAERLRGWGYRVEIAPNALGRDGYLSGSDAERLTDLLEALFDPAVKGVICSRGGYGSGRLLGDIPWEGVAATPPKPFVGFSDVGVLQVALWARAGWVTYSGLQAAHGLGGDTPDRAAQHISRALEGKLVPELGWSADKPLRLEPVNAGGCRGILLPICLSMLVSLIGTPFLPRLDGLILALEDTAEPPYRIDRMFWQLAASGVCGGIAGILLGAFLLSGQEISDEAGASARRHIGGLGVPIWRGLPYGHLNDRMTLPVGAFAEVQQDGALLIDTEGGSS